MVSQVRGSLEVREMLEGEAKVKYEARSSEGAQWEQKDS
jgi:hypothetical protein